jgi:hypothetical protein
LRAIGGREAHELFVVGLSSKRRFPKNGILQMLKMDENEREEVLVELWTDEEV